MPTNATIWDQPIYKRRSESFSGFFLSTYSYKQAVEKNKATNISVKSPIKSKKTQNQLPR